MSKYNQTILSDRRLQFMQGNGDVSARVQTSEYHYSRPKEETRRYAFLEVNVNHFGTFGKIRLPLSHATVRILIELLEDARKSFEEGHRFEEYLFNRCQLFDLMGGEERIIEHPLAPGRKSDTEEMDDEPEEKGTLRV